MLWGCASSAEGGTKVLSEVPDDAAGFDARDLEVEGLVSVPYRKPPPEGAAYRLVVEFSGDREMDRGTGRVAPRPLSESHLLEIEFTELPVADRSDAYLVVLDGLHYRLSQKNPDAERELEVFDDRLRALADGAEVYDLRGAQPKGDITPRKLLKRVFGAVRHDGAGNVIAMRPQGVPVARDFMAEFPTLRALSYASPALPPDPVPTGSAWRARRLPVTTAGELGLVLEVDFLLAGVQSFEGVPCAWILIQSEIDATDVPSAKGFRFERVSAKLEGEAWVELETSRTRLLRLQDEVRAAYTRGEGDSLVSHRLRHRTRLRMELRDPDEEPTTWADGLGRFAPRR